MVVRTSKVALRPAVAALTDFRPLSHDLGAERRPMAAFACGGGQVYVTGRGVIKTEIPVRFISQPTLAKHAVPAPIEARYFDFERICFPNPKSAGQEN
jgi:hypothetical protein